MTLDYTLEKASDRVELVNKILEENPNPSDKYIEILTNYIVFCLDKEEKKQKQILTDNRNVTITKRETSYEGLAASLESGEDGIYNMLDEGNKGAIFRPKVTITKKDLEEIPELRQTRDAIELWKSKLPTAAGKDIFTMKKAIKELRQDQYLIKDLIIQPINIKDYTHSSTYAHLDDLTHKFTEDGYPIPEGVTLLSPEICSIILCNYLELKTNSYGKFDQDTWYLLIDFEKLYKKALAATPVYERIVQCKLDNLPNTAIQKVLENEFGLSYTVEYISALWRKKIPKLIASAAEDEYLDWYYLNCAKGSYKKCSCCGQIKLAHNKYFSKNKTSKDGFYSICKTCRNLKNKKEV